MAAESAKTKKRIIQMLKNESGYPYMSAAADVKRVADADMNNTCGGLGNCLDDMPLAYVYAPNQRFRMLYSAEQALAHGTLFEELYKPMEVYGRE